MSQLTTIALLFGGANSEHEVSLASARGVLAAIDNAEFDVVLVGADRNGRWHRVATIDDLTLIDGGSGGGSPLPDLAGIDLALPVLHGRFGEDGTLQGLLELAGVPYAGCGVLASALAMDKHQAARVLRQAGIPVVSGEVVSAAGPAANTVAATIGYPVFVKPNRSGSSVGVSLVEGEPGLAAAIRMALGHDDLALLQPLDRGEEIDIGVLQLADGSLVTGAALRVHPAGDAPFFDYAAKYTAGGARFEVPADLRDQDLARLSDLAIRAFIALRCEGLARVDFFMDADGSARVNEVNTLPGLSALSQFPAMFRAAGRDLPDVVSTLIARGLAARPKVDSAARTARASLAAVH